jgi:hypothetical protein
LADPTPYSPSYSFSAWQASNPKNPPPGPKLDEQFARIQDSLDGVVAAVKDVRRSDGKLKNKLVTRDALATGLGAPIQDLTQAAKDYFDENFDTSVLDTIPATVNAAVDAKLDAAFASFLATGAAYNQDLRDIIGRLGKMPHEEGALDNGSNDDAAAWNKAIDKLGTGGGGDLIVPASIQGNGWLLGSRVDVLRSGVKIRALGNRILIGDPRTASGDLFQFGDAAHPVYGCGLKGFFIQQRTGSQRNGGIFLRAINARECDFEDLCFDHAYQCIEVQDFNSLRFRRLNLILPHQVAGKGFRAYSNQSSGRSDQLTIDDMVVQAHNAGSDGLEIDGFIHTGQFRNVYLLGCNRNLKVVNSDGVNNSTSVPSFLTFWNLQTDRSLDHSVFITAGYNLHFYGCDLANTSGALDTPYPQGNNDGATFYVSGATTVPSEIHMHGGRCGNSRLSAVALANCREFTAQGVQFFDSGKSSDYGTGKVPVMVWGANTGRNVVDGCRFLGANRSSYVLTVDAASGQNVFMNNNLYERTGMVNPSDPIADNTGTLIRTGNNLL